MGSPRVSVVMPVYNREKYIRSAIESILVQTYTNFEFLIVDDGSTDGTIEIIKSYDDSRIRLIQHEKNKGVAAARNTGYRNSKGEFIVIADSDDINLPNKLEKQVDYLDNNSEISIVGCYYKVFNSTGYINKFIYFKKDDEIRVNMLFWPGVPAASMFRVKKIKEENLLYHNESYTASVDYEWYAKMPKNIRFANIPELLYLYRTHEEQISTHNSSEQHRYAKKIRKALLLNLELEVSDYELDLHINLSDFQNLSPDSFSTISLWAEKIINRNRVTKVYDQSILMKSITKRFYDLCNTYSYFGEAVWKAWDSFKYKNVINELEINFNTEEVKKKVKGNITILGTKRSAFLLYDELIKQDIKINNFIDNNINLSPPIINGISVHKEESLETQTSTDTLILTILSDNRFLLKEKFMNKYPTMKVLLLDDLTT